MRIAILTNEYPPQIYGGAGVHVEYLTRELARVEDGNHSIEILCFGDQQVVDRNLTVRGVLPIGTLPFTDPRHAKFQETMPGQAAHRGSACVDHAFARTAPALEGRAAWLGLQREFVGRTHGL